MRVALVNTLYPPDSVGGAERSVRELAHSLVEEGHSVLVVALGSSSGARVVEEEDGSVRVVRIGSRAYSVFENGGKHETQWRKLRWHVGELLRLREYRALQQVLKTFRPEVVHLNTFAGFGWLAWRAARRSSAVFIHTLRDFYLTCLATTNRHSNEPCDWRHPACRVAKAPFRFTKDRPDIFVGVSASIVEEHRRRRRIRRGDRTAVIYPSPAVDAAAPERAKSPEPPPFDWYTFGILGRQSEDKGSMVALRAFARLPEPIRSRSRLVLAGPSSRDDRQRLASAAVDQSNVEMRGWQEQSEFFATVDCVLVPSQWDEPFGRIAAESLQIGSTVLLSRAGALPEVAALYGGRFEIVDDFHDPSAWAEAMETAFRGAVRGHPSTIPPRSPSVSEYLRVYSLAE